MQNQRFSDKVDRRFLRAKTVGRSGLTMFLIGLNIGASLLYHWLVQGWRGHGQLHSEGGEADASRFAKGDQGISYFLFFNN